MPGTLEPRFTCPRCGLPDARRLELEPPPGHLSCGVCGHEEPIPAPSPPEPPKPPDGPPWGTRRDVLGACLTAVMLLMDARVPTPRRYRLVDVDTGAVWEDGGVRWGEQLALEHDEHLRRVGRKGDVRRVRWESRIAWLPMMAVHGGIVLVAGLIATAGIWNRRLKWAAYERARIEYEEGDAREA